MKPIPLSTLAATGVVIAGSIIFSEIVVAQSLRVDQEEKERSATQQSTVQGPETRRVDDGRQRGGRDGQGRGQGRGEGRKAGSQGGRGAGRGGSRQPSEDPVFHTDVPEHELDVILARPTDHGVTVSVLIYADAEGYVEYGTNPGEYPHRTPVMRSSAAAPCEFLLDNLEGNTRYYYRVGYRKTGDSDFLATDEYTFHTQRSPGSTFTFTVQADSHLDSPTSPELYRQTLANARADKPDFHIDLGDTFMTDKYGRGYPQARHQYFAQRYYLGSLCRSSPFFFVIGNHDGEAGWFLDGTADNIGVWCHRMRTMLFPTPIPTDFYSGNTTELPHIGLPQNYYAWHWGKALFVVLDPFWPTTSKTRQGSDYWNRTLGREQYDWIKTTLMQRPAAFKFVFIHHLVGGSDSSGRGGAEAVRYFEWGGHNLDGRDEFKEKRPGWARPIHQLLAKHNVSIVFHGHDHFFAKQNLDGIVYQLVPQPAHGRYGNLRTAAEYGYIQGDILAGSGYLRVTVSSDEARIDYVLSVLPGDATGDHRNGSVAHSYTLAPHGAAEGN